MDVASLYINIIMRKVHKLVYKKQEEKKTKSTPSIFIGNLILMIFKSNSLAINSMWYFA